MPCCLISLSISCPVVSSHTSYPVVSLSHALLSHLIVYLMPCCLISLHVSCPGVSSHHTSHALLSCLIMYLMPFCLMNLITYLMPCFFLSSLFLSCLIFFCFGLISVHYIHISCLVYFCPVLSCVFLKGLGVGWVYMCVFVGGGGGQEGSHFIANIYLRSQALFFLILSLLAMSFLSHPGGGGGGGAFQCSNFLQCPFWYMNVNCLLSCKCIY